MSGGEEEGCEGDWGESPSPEMQRSRVDEKGIDRCLCAACLSSRTQETRDTLTSAECLFGRGETN